MIDKIKPAEERIHPMALDDKSVWCNAYFDEVVELRAAYEALQKENAELKATISNLTKAYERESNDGLKALEERDYWYNKAAEQLEAIEATAEFAKAFWEKADKHRDTRVMVSTFQQLERKLRTYLPASKNGE